ncbi:MAG TPA: hypothetical protein VF624_04365 [Tepidisphaeraceae bacterium]|jgi:hypothetical protein
MRLVLPAECRFGLGTIVVTSAAVAKLSEAAISGALYRHAACDWGDLCEQDRRANDQSLVNGGRLFSVYRDAVGTRFYVITEWDGSVTTVLLPEDY